MASAEPDAPPCHSLSGDVLLAKRDFVTKNRDLIVAFNAMLLKAMTFYLNQPDQAVDIAKARIPELASADREKSIQSIIVSRPIRSLTGLVDLDEIQKYVPIAVKAGLVKGLDPNTFDASKYFPNEYAKAAVNKLNAPMGK